MRAIANSGLDNIDIIDAVPFSLDLLITDPVARAVLAGIELSVEEAKELATTIESIRVSAVKPKSS